MFVEVLPEHVPLHLETLSRSKILEDFYMAGGTGLALQLGHRRKDLHKFSGIFIADPIDIGCMKIDAISSRGSCKDFIDLYFICNEIISLREMLEFFDRKYKGIEYNKVHISKWCGMRLKDIL